MKKLLKIFIFSFFFSFLVLNVNYVFASNNYENPGYNKEDKRCNSCSKKEDYQLTTGLPFFGADVTKCACIPVNTGAQFFLSSILKFIMGSVATLTTIIIIVAGFRWGFSAGNKKIIADSQVMIKNAIIGLIMSLTSGLMLSIINPNLLKPQILEVENVDISASYVNSCGSMDNPDYAKQRSVQLCRLVMRNNLPNKNGVIISWSVCDVSGVNCGKSQEVMSSNLDSLYDKSSGEYLPNCAYVNDHFGRFAIKLETALNFNGKLIFECSNDNGGISEVSIEEPKNGYVGTFCRGKNEICVNNKNGFCLKNPNNDACLGNKIYPVTLNDKGVFSIDSKSKRKFFDCFVESPYDNSDFEICAGGLCTRGFIYGQRLGIEDISSTLTADPNMRFGIKIINNKNKKGNFKIYCDLSAEKVDTTANAGGYNVGTSIKNAISIIIPGKIIESNTETNGIIKFCMGNSVNGCGVFPYNSITLEQVDGYSIKHSIIYNGKLNCGEIKENNTCLGFSIGNYYPCEINENNKCVNKK